MEKCICKKFFEAENGVKYREGNVYVIHGIYNGTFGVKYYAVKSVNGAWLGYVDIKLFVNYFDFFEKYYTEVDNLFNTIMDERQ